MPPPVIYHNWQDTGQDGQRHTWAAACTENPHLWVPGGAVTGGPTESCEVSVQVRPTCDAETPSSPRVIDEKRRRAQVRSSSWHTESDWLQTRMTEVQTPMHSLLLFIRWGFVFTSYAQQIQRQTSSKPQTKFLHH